MLTSLTRHVGASASETLGTPTRVDIQSSLSPFLALPEYRTIYPDVVVRALYELFNEYNHAFEPLVGANREWSTDYQFCTPRNFAVQIDMVGLPQTFLDEVASMPFEDVRQILRHMIFEIDSSLAMYQLLERLFPHDGQGSFFGAGWRTTLDDLRARHGRPIALLAVTDDKYRAMAETEFGLGPDGNPTDQQVQALTGFDAFFGPEQFKAHVRDRGGDCEYLLFVRASDPVSKLRNPGDEVDHPLLGDPEMRRIIRAHTLTLNVDDPGGDPANWINDTKAYMPALGMAYTITSVSDLHSPEFAAYLATRGIDPEAVVAGQVQLRAKPGKNTYGCYGHLRGRLADKRFRKDLARSIRLRGDYVIQPELPVPSITNADGMKYDYIDRIFISVVDQEPMFLGGFRNLMPSSTTEAQEGRIHGNGAAVWGEIIPAT